MTMRQKKSVAGLVLASALGVAVLAATGVAARSVMSVVRIEVVVEQMSFRGVDAANSRDVVENPTLRVRAGQTVEFVLKSADRGMKHDLVIPYLDVKLDAVAFGESTTVRFTAPAPGTYTYFCSMHPKLMRGELIVSE